MMVILKVVASAAMIFILINLPKTDSKLSGGKLSENIKKSRQIVVHFIEVKAYLSTQVSLLLISMFYILRVNFFPKKYAFQ